LFLSLAVACANSLSSCFHTKIATWFDTVASLEQEGLMVRSTSLEAFIEQGKPQKGK
ncbi:hypothetical protein ACJX0J_020804, partial [Zea mays]